MCRSVDLRKCGSFCVLQYIFSALGFPATSKTFTTFWATEGPGKLLVLMLVMVRATKPLELSWVMSIFVLLMSVLVGSAGGPQKCKVILQASNFPSHPLLCSDQAWGIELIPNRVHVGGSFNMIPKMRVQVPRMDMEMHRFAHTLPCVFTRILCNTFQNKLRNVSKYFLQAVFANYQAQRRAWVNPLFAATILKRKCEYSEHLVFVVGVWNEEGRQSCGIEP